MSGIPDLFIDSQDMLKNVLRIILAHRKIHRYAMIRKRTLHRVFSTLVDIIQLHIVQYKIDE